MSVSMPTVSCRPYLINLLAYRSVLRIPDDRPVNDATEDATSLRVGSGTVWHRDQHFTSCCRYVGNMTYLVGELTRQDVSESWQTMPSADRSRTASTMETGVEQSAYILSDLLQDEQHDFDQESIRECPSRATRSRRAASEKLRSCL